MEFLVVEKDDKNMQAQKQWTERRSQVIDRLTNFDQEKLRLLLGETEYDKILRLGVSAIPSEASSESEDCDDQRVLTLQPRGGVKRKIEQVDLAGDD
jgi:hypothetical protein